MNDPCSLHHPIGILSQGGVFIPVLKEGSLLPCSKTACFCTTTDFQTKAEIVFCIRDQGSTRLKEVYQFTLSNIEPQMSGVSRIDINMTMDEDFLLRVKMKTSTQEYFIDAFKIDTFILSDDFIEHVDNRDKVQQIKIDNLIESCNKINKQQPNIDLSERESFQISGTSEFAKKETIKKLKEIATKTSQQNAL